MQSQLSTLWEGKTGMIFQTSAFFVASTEKLVSNLT